MIPAPEGFMAAADGLRFAPPIYASGVGVPRTATLRCMTAVSAPTWDHDFARRSPMLAPLKALAEKLPAIGWPDADVLNHIADETGRRVVNARGQRVRFVSAQPLRAGGTLGFEPSTYEHGEVRVRRLNWHDLLNALVWITFPTAKASINGRHQAALEAEAGGDRSAARDALTHFDEDGVVVLSSKPELSEMLRGFAWKPLFWERRAQARDAMRFFLFGHALYEKALEPFVGMTGKALVFDVAPAVLERDANAQRAEVDRLTALHLWNPERMQHPRELCPLPVLGVPGWWAANEDAAFYDNTGYFRAARRARLQRQPVAARAQAGSGAPSAPASLPPAT